MYLVLGEKPSVAQALAKILGAEQKKDGYLEGNGWIVSWCLGHLAEYVSPETYDEKYQKWEFSDLPIVPDEWKLAVAKDKKAQFAVLKKLLNRSDVDYVVNGCDAGREGELIFKRVYELSKSRLPVKRLWISSLEDTPIREGFAHLKDGKDYENLCEASVCRAKADWLIGMNATRAFTTKYYKRLVVGRVQTPTLAMLVERGNQISHFQKEKYFNVHLDCNGLEVVKEKIFSQPEAEQIKAACHGASAVVESVMETEKSVQPPKLYDLTTLQRESNRYYGYTAKETLDFTQNLYEKKLVTYPRTDSQFLTEDMEQTAETVINMACEVFGFTSVYPGAPDVKRVMNNKKVSDHHAIIPTAGIESVRLSELSKGERDILCLVAARLLCATVQKHTFTETEVTVSCGGEHFTAKGKVIRDNGWKAVETQFRQLQGMKNSGTGEDVTLPPVSEGVVIENVAAGITEHFTSPPKPYSEDTLLSAMETAGNKEFEEDTEKKGLGTPATRAGIIEKLVSSGYAIRKGKQILPTADGIDLISLLPEYLKSAAMTAEWENRLLLMEKGELESGEFLQGITELIGRMLAECAAISAEEQNRFNQREEIGKCPVCGNPIYEGKKNFYCSDRSCSFSLWKENRYLSGMRKQIDKRMAKDLLQKGRTHVTDFYSQKTGKNFTADLLLEVVDGRANFRLEFPKRKGGKKANR
ncbi:DNA topoisomerase III [Enterocloster clostridioformis]|nr:DNA topoisomerase III [Lachnoclostridium sp. YL32]NDO31713.1 DNA topoisomerase III [Enterocloster clostridioformis]OXE61057.1 DNA topoisomerase III [Enterocloster clostridioformis]QQR00053.1 DNA topoisomerase 3 [Enterocloster clostridioformis]